MPLRFVLAGVFAALVNFTVRIALSAFMPYGSAIFIAFFIGMTVAFLLNRRFVFQASSNSLTRQTAWFVTINLFALVQTLAVSLLLARVLLPMLGLAWHNEEIAHAAGIGVPIVTSYLGHRRLTFR
jgi:putative flippase GtrA